MKPIPNSLLVAALLALVPSALPAAINITAVAAPDTFTAIPPVANWSTISAGTGTDAAITDAAGFDTKIIAAANVATITTVLGSSPTIPPSTNGIARFNTGAQTVPAGITFLQTRPTGVDYLLLLATLSNATGGAISSFKVEYDYSKATDTASETIKGHRVYWSVTGAPGSWQLLTDLSVDTTGTYDVPQHLSTNVFLPAPLAAGGTVYLLWADQNSSGTDASYHIDNFAATLGLDCVLTAMPTGVVRSPGALPLDPTDDTVDFTLDVTATGTGLSPTGWKITAPASLGVVEEQYATPRGFTGVPISSFTDGKLAITVADADTAACFATATVGTPHVFGMDVAGGNVPIYSNAHVPTGWAINEAALTSTQSSSPAQTDFVIESTLIDLSAAGTVTFSATLDAIAGASSGFELLDGFGLELDIDGTTVSVLGVADVDANGRLNGAAAAGGPELPDATVLNTTKTFDFVHVIHSDFSNLRIRIIGSSNSPSETFLVKNVKLDVGGPVILLGAPANVIRVENGPGEADDTLTFDLTISGTNGGATWTTTTPGLTAPTNAFGTVNFTLAAPLPASPATITIADADFPAATRSVAVTIPGRYIIGQKDFGAGLSDVISALTPPPAALWVNDPVARTLTMSAGVAAASVVASESIDLTATDAVLFTAKLNIADTSAGSNLEVGDKFKAELLIDAGLATEVTVNLVDAWDKGDGANSTVAPGTNGPKDGFINGYSGTAGTDLITSIAHAAGEDEYNANLNRDEWNTDGEVADTSINNDFLLSSIIPASASSVQLIITSNSISGTEVATVSDVLFGPPPVTDDNDGDGITNTDELIMGTDPNDANSVLRLTQNAANPAQIDFPTVNGRFYRVYSSDDAAEGTHLQVWNDTGLGFTGNGAGTSFLIDVAAAEARRFYTLHVMETDGPWPPVVPVP